MDPMGALRTFKPLPESNKLIFEQKSRFRSLGVGGMGAANAPRQGPAMPQSACQTIPDVLRSNALTRSYAAHCKETCKTKVTASFQSSDLQSLTQGLRGEVDTWETLPLNNPPLLESIALAPCMFCDVFVMLFLAK